MENEKFYSILRFKNITAQSVDTHIKEADSLKEACAYKDCSFVIVQRKLPGESFPGTGLFCPKVYSYKFLGKNEQPYFINYKNAKCDDYIIVTKRRDYYYETAIATINITDRNKETALVALEEVYDDIFSFFNALILLLTDFTDNCSSDWNLYRIRQDYSEKIIKLQEQLGKANTQVADLKLKLKASRTKNKRKQTQRK
ncbi:MAG: hypothetical protein GXC73_12585 [Chitinophagaceae bacterium]|nr:hypothetical protein [Chitinophagaceae bacterium]